MTVRKVIEPAEKGCREPPKSSLSQGWKARPPRLGAKSCSYDPAAPSPASTSEACVTSLSTWCVQSRGSGFAASRGEVGRRGTGPAITDTGTPSTAFEAVEVSSSMDMIGSQTIKSIIWQVPVVRIASVGHQQLGSGQMLWACCVRPFLAPSPCPSPPLVHLLITNSVVGRFPIVSPHSGPACIW